MKCKNCGHKIGLCWIRLTRKNVQSWHHKIDTSGFCITCHCGCTKPEPTQTPDTSTIPGGLE